MESRDKVIVRTSIIGIIANIMLGAFKIAVGLIANAFTVVLDAVNNLTDALSSVITIAGTKLAGRRPDKKHPLGHGRIEYLSTMLIAAIILYAGITAGVESVKKIIHPAQADYSAVTLIVIAAAIAVKIAIGLYFKRTGNKVNSGSLIASGKDALYDAILSASVLISAVIFMVFHINLEAYVGIIISAFIIKSGIELMLEAVDDVVGKRAEKELTDEIKATICSEPDVKGAYDLLLHSYGPDMFVGSVHIEIPETLTAKEIDLLERRIAEKVYDAHGIIMAGIGIYSFGEGHDEMRTEVYRIISRHDGVLQIHGYYANEQEKTLSVDVILDFELEDREAVFTEILSQVKEAFPDWEVKMTLDLDL
ncbi:MAG: cation transporter [Clostridia bacterium]|nr:cation transporter [Clostridia bacterium]